MHATGPELADPQANEPAWEQGGGAFEEEPHHSYDVPAFVRGVHAAMRTARWHEHESRNDEAGKVAMLFSAEYDGPFMPFKSCLTRYCSLNLESIAKHGTLEMRRYNGTCDPLTIAHWATFCVAFVESFRGSTLVSQVFDPPSAASGLATLQRLQEVATPEELIQAMAGHLDPATIRYLLEDACPGGQKPAPDAAGQIAPPSSSVHVEQMSNFEAVVSRCVTM